MTRIIAIDGCDCTGKSTAITQLIKELTCLKYKPFVFHLSSSQLELDLFFTNDNFPNQNRNDLSAIIQYEKFIQTFQMFQSILDADINNVIILDRTPFSEFIWSQFFKRESKSFNDKKLMENFVKLFDNIKSKMLYIELTATTDIIANRIILKDSDYKNFIVAFDNLKIDSSIKSTCLTSDEEESSKILYMINFVKEQYEKLKFTLRDNNIFVKTFSNNSPIDTVNIVNYILGKIINN